MGINFNDGESADNDKNPKNERVSLDNEDREVVMPSAEEVAAAALAIEQSNFGGLYDEETSSENADDFINVRSLGESSNTRGKNIYGEKSMNKRGTNRFYDEGLVTETTWSWLNGGSGFDVISDQPQDLSTLVKGMQDFIEDNLPPNLVRGGNELTINVSPIAKNSEHGIIANIVKVEANLKKKEGDTYTSFVDYTYLVLESSIEKGEVTLNERDVFVPYPCQYILNGLIEQVDRYLGEEIKRSPRAKDFILITKNFYHGVKDTDDAKFISRIKSLIANIIEKLKSFSTSHSTTLIRLGDIEKTKERISLTIVQDEDEEQITDLMGNPIRSDIRFTTTATSSEQVNRTLSNLASPNHQSKVISEAVGYIDIVWVGGNNIQTDEGVGYFGYQPQRVIPKVYQAELVITDTVCTYDQGTVGTLIGILNASSYSEGNRWLQSLMPKSGGRASDMNSILGIGWEISFDGDTYDRISDENFDERAMCWLYNATFHKGLAFCIDVEQAGVNAWKYDEFYKAACGSSASLARIIAECDALTNGKFSSQLKSSKADPNTFFRVNDRDNQVLLGSYNVKKTDEKRDIRDLGYLAVANYIQDEGQRDVIVRFSDAVNGYLENQFRKDKTLKDFYSNILGAVEYRGYADRIYISSQFISILRKAANECGYKVVCGVGNSFINTGSRSTNRLVGRGLDAEENIFRQVRSGDNYR